MFYGNGDNNLENSILSDLKEMELSSLPEQITIIALIDRPSPPSGKFGSWSDTRLFRVVRGDDTNCLSSTEIGSNELSLTVEGVEELDMSDSSVITKFINFCKASHPSDYYALIIGSHGDGWKFPSISAKKSIGYDQTSHNTSTSIYSLASSLKVNPLDVIIFDACNMGNIETLYELRGAADFIVASPNPLPLSGFNYTDAISGLEGDLSPEIFSLRFSASWKRVHDEITMMVYSMERFSDFMNYSFSGNTYIDEIHTISASNPTQAMNARNSSIRYSVSGTSDHIDIADYSAKVAPGKNFHFTSFILTEYKPKLSVYFPATSAEFNAGYRNTSFAAETKWDELLQAVFQ